MTDLPQVRIRTARAKDNALVQYQELRRAGKVAKALVIVEHPDGNITVLGQMLTPMEIAPLLGAAAVGISHALEQVNAAKPEKAAPAPGAPVDGARRRQARKERGMHSAPDGTLLAPDGENIIRCGECDHPRWYVTVFDVSEMPARFACAHCGNEVVMVPIHPEAGNA